MLNVPACPLKDWFDGKSEELFLVALLLWFQETIISDTEMVGSIACADMLFRTNLIAMVGGGTAPRFDEKAGTVSAFIEFMLHYIAQWYLSQIRVVDILVLTSRWSWGQRSRSSGPLVLKSLITWQCLGLGPSNLEGILVHTSRWHQGQRSWSRSPWPLVLEGLITWQCLGLGPSNLEGMLVSPVDDTEGKRSRSQWPLVQNKLITRQCLGLGLSNIVGMFLMTRRWPWS